MSGWLLGLSMVATTFAADTPGLVTELVRTKGVSGNWAWWAFLLTGMLTVFLYARLWRRSGVRTDLEFYELRYSGRPAVVLRVFRALYLGVVFNVIVMAVVSVAAIKLGQVLLGASPATVLICGGVTTLVLSAFGGFRAVVLTDCLLFGVAMTGAIAAAYFALQHPSVGGLSGLFSHDSVAAKQALTPAWDWSSTESRDLLATTLLVPLTVQWWSVWYPGAEPGGGGYLAQRMLAAKNEDHAFGAVMLFNVAHYALRPWPWILVALASIVVYPELADLRAAFPAVDESKLGHDLAYPAMLTMAPIGWRGLIIASLLSAYVSTISTHLNWGASYVTGDFYQRVVDPAASPQRLVMVGRISTVVMMLLASLLALWLQTAKQGFDLLLSVGAGTDLIYILRWYWWRVNAFAEIVAMAASVVVAAYLQFGPDHGLAGWQALCLGVAVTTAIWFSAIWLSPPERPATLEAFCRQVRPSGPGWRRVYREAARRGDMLDGPKDGESIRIGLLRMALGCVAIYSLLFAVGKFLYGEPLQCGLLALTSVVSTAALAATYWRAPPTPRAA
ncbi:Sodium/glucose cotransporter [Pirellulimonas nuda]|uniref:Sodium/glucose cotransporter n=2 Tax=Pirellulimonas nuda TaxID=2528009 RepID=A0A518DBM8_9BACT|nr:Sodium/glucose cotransporter [Pirellulimonas nuda]